MEKYLNYLLVSLRWLFYYMLSIGQPFIVVFTNKIGGRYEMTDKQRIFADEYLKDLNGTRAYKVAYPNVKKDTVAATAAGRLLRNVEVHSYIDFSTIKILIYCFFHFMNNSS